MRRRTKKVSFDFKVITDVIFASLLVQKAPGLIDMIVPIPDSIKAVAGIGAGYLVGTMLKKPTLANASIALGAVDFISPFIDNLIGGGSTEINTSMVKIPNAGISPIEYGGGATPDADLADYIRLNGYVSNPNKRQSFDQYANSY